MRAPSLTSRMRERIGQLERENGMLRKANEANCGRASEGVALLIEAKTELALHRDCAAIVTKINRYLGATS